MLRATNEISERQDSDAKTEEVANRTDCSERREEKRREERREEMRCSG